MDILKGLGYIGMETLKIGAKVVITGTSTIVGVINTAFTGECRKCGCKHFKWNGVSEIEKTWLGKDDQAHRNCTCGHHRNYHD